MGTWTHTTVDIPITIIVTGTSTPTTTTKDYTITGTATNGNISLDGNAPSTNNVTTTVTATYTGGSLTSLAPNSLTVKATPGKGYHFVSLAATNGALASTSSSTTTYTPVDKDDTITATFEANEATVTLQKDGTTKLSGVQVELKKGGVTLTATTDSNGVATFTTTSGKELEAGKWEIHTPANTASGASAKKAGELTIPDDSTDTTEATIDYWSVELEAGTNALGVGFAANPTDSTKKSTDAYLPGETVTVYAKPDTKYVGTDATWTAADGNGSGAACSGTGDSATCTVGEGKTKFTASYNDMAAYTAKLKLLKNGVSTDLVKGATVDLSTAANGTADATRLTEDANGVYTNTKLKDKSYGYASITLATGEKYVVQLAQAFDYTHEEESVTLWEVNVNVDTTATAAAGSRTPYGSAVVTAGGVDHTANSKTKAAPTFLAPAAIASGADVVTLKSTTPTANMYIDRATKNWWVGTTTSNSHTNANQVTGYTFKPTAATYVTAYFTPKAKLDVTPVTASVNLKEGANSSFVTAVAAADGLVENIGATTTSGGLKVSVTANSSFSATSDTTAASYLNVALGATTDLLYDGTTTLAIGAKPQALTVGQSKTVYVWIYSDDSTGTTIYDSVAVTLNVAEGEPLTVDGTVAWDTYPEKVTGTSNTSVDLTLEIKDGISSVTSVSLGATVLTANTDYTVANGADANHKKVTITADGLKKLAEANIKGGGNSITVKAKNAVNQEKDASVNFTLSNSMPYIKSLTFNSGVTSDKWTKGTTFPTTRVEDSKATPGVDDATTPTHTLTGVIDYTWYNGSNPIVSGSVTVGNSIPALTQQQQNALNPGDTVRLEVKGTGKDWDKNGWTDNGVTKYWDAKPSGSDRYKESVVKIASFVVKAPEVTLKVDLKGATTAEEDANGYYTGNDITVGKNELNAGSVLLNTSTTASKKYEFVEWTLADNTSGIFGVSGSATSSTADTPIFTPYKPATVVANWKKIATVEYTHGANATGPNADSDGDSVNDQYEETLVNNGALITDIKSVAIDTTSANNFDLTVPATGVTGDLAAGSTTTGKFIIKPKATTPAGTYTITITTEYLKEGADTASEAKDDVKKTVVQTVVYVVPEPKYDIVLEATVGGTNTGNYKGTNYAATSSASQTIPVAKNDSVALTAMPADGYRFVEWTLTTAAGTSSDKLANAITSASNAYGGVTYTNTITAVFAPVTDLSETDTKKSDTQNVGYANTPNVFAGTVSNAGAKDAAVKFELKNQKFNAGTAGTYFTLVAPTPDSGKTDIASSVTINAKGGANASQTVTVNAVNGLGVGIYTADLVITEITAAPNPPATTAGTTIPYTANGLQTWTIPITFTVGGGDVTVQVKLDGVNKNAERVELQPASGASVLMTVPASGNDNYTAKDLTLGTPYNILVNGVNTGKTVTPVTGSTAQTIVELWTLDLTPDPNNKSKGDVSASGGTLVTITGGTADTADDKQGYVDGSSVTLTAAPKPDTPGYKFVKWTDEDPANDNGKDPWYNTNESALNPATITMKKAHTIIGHFDDIPAETRYYDVTYKDTDGTVLATMKAADGDTHTIIADPYKANQVFLYWTSDFDSNHYKKGDANYGSVTVDKDIVFTAVWLSDPTWPNFPNGVYGESYASADATQTGFTFDVSDGTATANRNTNVYNGLPDGLSINATTGIISGKPAETGEYHFKLTITHTASGKTWEREYVITIDKAIPSLANINFSNVANDVKTDALQINGKVHAELNTVKADNSANEWVSGGKDYTYTDYVDGTSTAQAAGSLKVVEYEGSTTDANTKIQFGSATSKVGKVKFTPSTAIETAIKAPTHQTAQKYSDIYKDVTVPCTFNLGGKTYGISVTPDRIPDSTTYTSVDIKVGGTLPDDDAWQFDVFNHGNQGAHVTYTLEGANAENFILKETYTHKFKDTDSAPNNDAIDANTTGAAAGVSPSDKEFTVGLAQADNNTTGKKKVDTSIPGVYVAQVRVENWSVADDGTKTLQDTIIVPIRFEVEKDSFDASVQIDLYNLTGTNPVAKQKEPRGASVVFKYASGNASNDVTAAWKSDTNGSTDAPGVYTGSLNKGTTYHVVVNGFDTGVVVDKDHATGGIVKLYKVKVTADSAVTGKTVPASDIEALQTPYNTTLDDTYLAAGESLSVATPVVYSTSATPKTNYDFTKWQYAYLGDANATDGPTAANYPTFTMGKDDPKPVTLTALYTERVKDTVTIIYHENKDGTSTAATTTDVLWNQVVTKSVAHDISSTEPTRNGYAFKEWATVAATTGGTAYDYDYSETSGGTTTYPKRQVAAANLGSDLHLFARWTKLTPTFGAVKDTYYSERYSASVAASWKNGDATANAPAVTYSVTTTGVTAGTGETAGLPGGLTMGATGVITGRAYQVGTFKFKVVATAVDDTNVTWTSGELTIVVKKEQPRLANAGGTNAEITKKFSTGLYYADVVADILKYREGVEVPSTDTDFYSNTSLVDATSHKAKVDIWEDGKVIIGAYDATDNPNGLVLNGTGSGATTTVAADGGVLSIDKLDSVPNQTTTSANEGDSTFTSGNNTVPLLWTPGDTKTGYPFRDGNTTPNKWSDIFLMAETNVYLTPGKEYKVKVEPATIKFKVVKGKTDYTVLDNGTYKAIDASTADNFTITNEGNVPVSVIWELTDTNKPVCFDSPTTDKTGTTAGAPIILTAKPCFNATVGSYTAEVKVTYSDDGEEKGTATVALVLEVVEDTTFPFEVDTYLDNFEADTNATTFVGSTGKPGDVTSVVLESTDSTHVGGTANEPSTGHVTGKYPFILDATKTYTVKVNGILLPGVYINKTSTSPLRVDLYELALAQGANGTGTAPAASPTGGPAGYFLPGQRVDVTANAAASGYKFDAWDEVLDTSSTTTPDIPHADFSVANQLSYVMGSQPVQLTAKYSKVGARFKVVLNDNDGDNNDSKIGYHGSETYKDVLHGGNWEAPHYMVDDGSVFGLDMAVTTAATKKYTMTWQDHTFLGWALTPTATSGGYSFTANQANANADKGADDPDDDTITLYAVWLADSDLDLQPLTVNGVYKHAITPDVYHGATGGSGDYTSYVGANEAFSATDKIFDLTLETITANGDHKGESKVSGTPDDAGTKYSTVTVTDSKGDKASALYTIVIAKADVEPNTSTPLPTTTIEVPHAATAGEIKQAILDELAKVQMDGKDTSETKINGVWEILTEPDPDVTSEQTISVKFTPTNAATDTADDHDNTKDGDHYNPYPGEVKVLVSKKLITQVELDKIVAPATAPVMKPVVNEPLVFTVPTGDASRSLTPSEATFAASADATTGDVYIADVQWAEDATILTTGKNAVGGVDYVLTITLAIRDGSPWRFDTSNTAFNNSKISEIKAEKIAVNDTMVVLRVKFPKKVTTIDVKTATPKHGTTANSVTRPDDNCGYTVETYTWYQVEEDAGGNVTYKEVGEGAGKVAFDKDHYYDLVVTVKLVDPTVVDFTDAIKATAKNDLMNDLADNTEDKATVNAGIPPAVAANITVTANQRFVKAESAFGKDAEGNAAANSITIRYRAFKPADQELVSIRVEGVPGVYYAQTKADGNHWKLRHDATDATATVGNTGSKNDVTFKFNGSALTVYPIYRDTVSGDLITNSPAMDPSDYKIYTVVNGTRHEIPADGFKDQYTHDGKARTDVSIFDGKTLIVVAKEGANDIIGPVAGTLRVRQLTADSIAKVGATQPTTAELRYEQGEKFASTLNTMKATLTFNSDVDELKNSELEKNVTELTYDDYSAYADTPATGKFDSNKTFFFEYGPADAPTFVAHATGDPSNLGANALLQTTAGASAELVPGTTEMTADMAGKTLYASYVDVNHNLVRVALGVIDMGSDFKVTIKDTNLNDPEYADELVGMPQTTTDGTNYTDAADPNAYTYEWKYWKPSTTGDDNPEAPAELSNKKGSWETLPNTTPDRDKQIHHPGKDEVGVYIHVVATDRASGTKQYSEPKKIQPRSLNFDVKPWNKAPASDKNSSNIHQYEPSDFTFTDVEKIWDATNSKFVDAEAVFGGVANGDVLELTPATDWNATALAGSATTTAARPNYRNGDGWTKPLRGEVGDKITWPVVRDDGTVTYAATAEAGKTSGYLLGGADAKVAKTLTNATDVAVYRLRDQDQIFNRGTILSVEVIDENDHDHEYGDKLTANPIGPNGQPDTNTNLTYQWQVKQPDGTWKNIDGETGKDHHPGKEEVGETIRVVVTDPTDGTKRESGELEIKARSLNFVVERQNRLHTDDTDATNTHTYVADDFTLTPVYEDATDVNNDKEIDGDDMDSKKMLTFNSATKVYGGLYAGDNVTLFPAETRAASEGVEAYTSWNDADATRPDYRTPTTDTTIADSTSSGAVGKKIIWPQVFKGNEAKGSTDAKKVMESAGQFSDYTLGGTNLKNTKGVDVYRLAPQGEQLDRGEITGGAGGHVMHVNVDFQNYPTILSAIPGHPDAEAADATGDDHDGAPKKDVAVTDKRETRPGEIRDHANDTHRTDGTDGYPGSAYTATWYPAKETTNSVTNEKEYGVNFDPTHPTTTGGAALSGNFNGKAATVVVKVIPRAGYKYELLGDVTDNAKTATKFHFHFSKDFTVDLPVKETGPAGVRRVNEKADGTVVAAGTADSYEVYYMWYTFKDLKTPAFVSDPLDLGLTADDFIYYANTDVTEVAPATQVKDHHHTANTANNTPIPGGKAAVDFTYVLDKVRTAIDKSGAGTALERTDKSSITIKSAGYGTDWRLKAGTWSGDTDKKALDVATTSEGTTTYAGRTFKDTVNLPTSANTGDSQVYDGLYVYIEVKVGSDWMTYGAPLGVTETGAVTAEALTVKELEAESITASGTISKLDYYYNTNFAVSNVTGGTVTFNKDNMNVSYTAPIAAAKDGKGVNSYLEMKAPSSTTYEALADGQTLVEADDGKIIYLCYTDVNEHTVRTPLGALKMSEKPDDAPTDKPVTDIMVSYLRPVAGDTPATKPQDWGSKTQVNIADDATTWYELGGTLATDGTQWTNTTTAESTAFKYKTWYRVESIITANNATPPYKFGANQKLYINGQEVTVGGDAVEIKQGEDVVGYVKAVWENDATKEKIKAMYIAQTLDKTQIGAVAINYHTPAAPNKVKDYANYADTEAVTVPNKDDETNPTKWYKVTTDADAVFNSLSNPLTIGTNVYAENSIYVVENLVKANGGYELTTNTVVHVDGHEAAVSAAGTVTTIDATAKSGLIKVKAKLNSDGTITVQSLYKVPNNTIDPVSITYPEPVKGQTPTSVRASVNTLWTYNALINEDQVSVAETHTTATAPQTDGTTWYTTTLTAKPANKAAVTAQEVAANKLTVAFAANKYYLVVGTITPDTGYYFDFDATGGVTVTVNGIPVKVDGDMASKSNAEGEEIGWAAAVKSGNNVKVYYVAKTLDDNTVTAVGISYTTPAATNAAAEYVTYLDQEMVTVYKYAAAADHDNMKDPDGTKWYPTTAGDFNESGKTMMEIGATDDAKKYQPGTHYLVVNVIHPKTGYKLAATTQVVVDGELTVTAGGTAVNKTGATEGLLSAKANLNSDGTITVRSIYKVPETKPGQVNSITITHPEPKQGTAPIPNLNPATTLWTYQYLSDGVEVSRASTSPVTAPQTDGSIWYTTKLDADPASLNDFEPDQTDNTKDMVKLTTNFDYDTYYMVEGIITPASGNVFADAVTVTVNGILVTVGGDFKAKYDNEGNAIGWAMAKWAKKVDGKNDDGTDKLVDDHTKILARYIAKTEPAASNIIWKVQAAVTEPTEGGNIITTADLDYARFKSLTSETDAGDATSNVTTGTVTWKESSTFGSGYTAVTGTKFERGKYYQAEFEVWTDYNADGGTGNIFQNDTNDFVAFRINGVLKAGVWGVNDKKTPDETESNGIKVMTKKVTEGTPAAENPNKYKITVQFPLTGDLRDLTIIGLTDQPQSKQPVSNANIYTEQPTRPYHIINEGAANEQSHWEHWNGSAWVNTTAGETFKAGDFYRAVMDIELEAGQENFYRLTGDTAGRVNTTDATKATALPTAAPTVNNLKTSIIYNETDGKVVNVTLAQEFRVPKIKTLVEVDSPVPTAGAYAYQINPDVKIHSTGVGKYTLSDGVDIQGRWYDSSYNLMDNTKPFEEGKDYYLITTATAESDYIFYEEETGYKWYETGTGATMAASATTLFKDGGPTQWKLENGEVVLARVAFKYTIPVRDPVLIPGWAEQPATGSALSSIRTEDKDFDIVGETWWTKGEQESADHIAVGTVAEEKTTYFAHIKIRPKDGVIVKNEAAYYRFNLNTTADTKFVTWEYLEDEDVYYLVYQFDPTKEKPQTPSGGGGGGGGGTSESPIVYYHLKDQGVTEDPTAEKVRRNSKPKQVPKVKPTTGLKFLGWSEVDPSTLPAGTLPTLVDPTTFKITKDKWFYAVYEQGEEVDHLHYVIGFPNGTFAPDAKITRAEVATIIARSCLEGFVEGANYGNPGNYNDVTTHWAFSAIAYCAREGVFNGYEDGTFRPDRYITRQELATVVARLAGIQTSEGMPFNDRDQIASWATNGVYTAYANGWVNGYEDNTFQPEREISRAETVKIFNGYLKRGVDVKGLDGLKEYVHSGVASNIEENGHDEYMTWPDVSKTHWAYYEIIEAANDHNYHWQDAEKKMPPEDWDEVYIDEKWRYNDNETDGAEKRDENMSLQKTFTVTYLVSSNGVTYDAITETVERFASPKPENMPIAVPNEGYRFAGWSSTDPSTGTITLEDPTASSVTADKWFYAVFEEDKPYELPVYSVTYVIGALGSYDGATLERVELYQAPSVSGLPQPIASEGYRFAGWSETDPANGSYTIVDPTANYVTGDKTFYAVYEEADEPYQLPVYTVTYVIGANGSYDGATVERVEMYQAPSVSGLPQPIANEGYHFVGWSETDPADGSYTIMDPTANYVTGDKTFYAVYEAN